MIKTLLSRLPFLNFNQNQTMVIGVVVQQHQITAVCMEKKQKNWLIVEHYSAQLTSDLVLTSAIVTCLKKIAAPSALVSLILPSQSYQLVQIDKPNLSPEEIQQSLPWTVKDLVTINSADIIADYIDHPVKQGNQDKISVFVTNRSFITPIIDAIKKASAKLELLSCEEIMLTTLVGKHSAANLIISQELGQEPSLLIVRDGAVLFARRLRGFSRISSMTLEDLQHGLLDSLSLEIQRSIDFFESQLKQPPLRAILLSLPSPYLVELATELGQHFPVKVEKFTTALAACEGQDPNYHLAIAAAMELIGVDDEN
ncbi:hypothetical protein [Pseudoalteromonas tunicata]|jgi:MSHA biogenesis protein MshI|uniref:Putative Mannose-sensitive agglutinin (MSHA) biogenesis protein MshI (Pilus type IV)with frame shift n=1 Tax=Pseudoalteromonas tunicata D2 TaxID=87626 RepID=A4C7Y2_9GAMM|nr:hypothetical protein [Pseudoalteromonas tunicata]ATC93204.1 MSHA biogenesis protein MshI [Pseudoalteromonas tunicata]AXT32267.1 MSHA biogenesis protein MshI [Pseudoalteromonas tunicata]EAR28697.1 putative Mannose-sensitive agglutinin (MSHA) biogenesis protein MshI (pilus type IV)with frame shift [Pseudoalteromonas tunicata D2]MDP4983985.1 MSHA biogenesis protein MshI [Pseudoalteromonas tunicata]MDP5212754.1 MSHA biogenesis protein MshI [Pseudoalteromonas tunicata]